MKKTNPVYILVGGRVRMRRKFPGISLEGLGGHLDLTQQIRKYERGSNCISASKLYEILTALKVAVAYFFEGYGEGWRRTGSTKARRSNSSTAS